MKKDILKFLTPWSNCFIGFFTFCSLSSLHSEDLNPSFYQGDSALSESKESIYNTFARTFLKDFDRTLPDVWISASFLYYYANLEGLNLANSAMIAPALDVTYRTALTSNGEVIEQKNSYKPAFEVGLGASFEEWSLFANYTWIRQTTDTQKKAPTPLSSSNQGAWICDNWFMQPLAYRQAAAGSFLSSQWSLGIDIADLFASRPFYRSKTTIVSPFFGLRSIWIRNRLDLDLTLSPLLSNGSDSVISSFNHSNSWALGPRFGTEVRALLGKGFRLEGNGSIAALYTAYTTVEHTETTSFLNETLPKNLGASNNSYNTIRPEVDFGLGVGYGTYLAKESYHIDFSLDYDFLIFWDQNLMRQLMDQVVSKTGGASGDLYLHGLKLNARFDF